MKKKILGLSLIACLFFGMNAFAQNACPESGKECKKEVCCKDGKDKKMKKKGDKNPFEGINLTDAQKQQLKELKAKRMEARKQKSEAMKAEKQKRDSVAMADRKKGMREYLDEVKAIIGPDNYVIFLENSYMSQSSPAKKGHGMKAHKMKGHKDGKKFDCCKDGKGPKQCKGEKGAKNPKTDK